MKENKIEFLFYLLKSKCTNCISSDISTSTVAWGRVCHTTKEVFATMVRKKWGNKHNDVTQGMQVMNSRMLHHRINADGSCHYTFTTMQPIQNTVKHTNGAGDFKIHNDTFRVPDLPCSIKTYTGCYLLFPVFLYVSSSLYHWLLMYSIHKKQQKKIPGFTVWPHQPPNDKWPH